MKLSQTASRARWLKVAISCRESFKSYFKMGALIKYYVSDKMKEGEWGM
jgi:hypothetical protein